MNAAYATTFADAIFQRVPMDQQTQVNQYGLFTLYFPSDSLVQDHDTVNIDGLTFFIFETYRSEGLWAARATSKPDMRINIVYIAVGAAVYDPTQLKTVSTQTSYNITAQIQPTDLQEAGADNVVKDAITALIDRAWLGVIPKLNDKLVVGGKTYLVRNISQNMVRDQWQIIAVV